MRICWWSAGVAQVEDHFDALVDIALHPIGAAEIDFGFAAVAEDVDAAVLEEAADHAADANPAAESAHSRTQRAGAAHDEFDLHARLRGFVKGVDDFFVEKRIHLGDDKGGAPGLCVSRFAIDQIDEIPAEIQRRDEKRRVVRALGIGRQVIEDVMHGGSDDGSLVSKLRSV